MRSFFLALLLATAASTVATARHSHSSRSLDNKRATADPLAISSYLASNFAQGATPPGARPGDSAGQTVDNKAQYKGCNAVFIDGPQTGGSPGTGWTALPQTLGFDLKRLAMDGGHTSAYHMPYCTESTLISALITVPYYQERKDTTKIRRLVLVQSGSPRNSWGYAALMRNNLLCASMDTSVRVDWNSIMIAAPQWFNQHDRDAGAAQATDLYWTDNEWAYGPMSTGPVQSVSTFDVTDALIDQYFGDKSTFPNLESIVIAGHSEGGSLVQRYAMLRKPDGNDARISHFAANSGSYAWPIDTRPASGSCAAQMNVWPYGLQDSSSSDVAPYAKSWFSKSKVLEAYYGRTIHFLLGDQDNGRGDPHCQADFEGPNHLVKGKNLQTAEGARGQQAHTWDIVAGAGHVDYQMFSARQSQHYLFISGMSPPPIAKPSTATSAPLAKPTSPTSSSSTISSASASPSASSSMTLPVAHTGKQLGASSELPSSGSSTAATSTSTSTSSASGYQSSFSSATHNEASGALSAAPSTAPPPATWGVSNGPGGLTAPSHAAASATAKAHPVGAPNHADAGHSASAPVAASPAPQFQYQKPPKTCHRKKRRSLPL